MANTVAGRFLLSNVAVIVCCGCYLLWWILAFKPVNPVPGLRSGWLLIPAVVAGFVGIVLAVRAGTHSTTARRLFPPWRLLVAGIACYLVLLLLTRLLFHRQVTAELVLMVGWAVLVLYQLNALYGAGVFGRQRTLLFVAVSIAALVGCLVCYTIYYDLGPRAGFVVGIVPLALGAMVMAVISAAIFRSPVR
ncbi:hypothetical protein [Microlunatus soli]|uniref:Uncharacterized protein n=1 Tax=Microlunatus soli TaxID=630515 RepID=A0A1H1ZLP5_9ACTN|nr:hypothetical protein [Microlunatus soli]SDT34741.1 hypothetical protein SAMN04489812_5313 [Microlunatus soli]